MFNPAWLFVIASIIAVFGILIAFRKLMANVQTMIERNNEINMAELQKEQTRFFIQVAITEAIPILLIVYGFMRIEELSGETFNILAPLLIIAIAVLIALINLIVLRRDLLGYEGTSTETKNLVNTLIFIGLAMICAIPIISLVALFTMNT